MEKVLPVLLALIGIASGVSDPEEFEYNNPNYKMRQNVVLIT